MADTASPHRLGVQLRLTGGELLEQSLRSLGESPDAAAIHRVRVALKRLRAWLRLAADREGAGVRQLDREWRDLSRTLAPCRNVQALADSWQRFHDRSGHRSRAAQAAIEPEWTAQMQRSTVDAFAAWSDIAHRLSRSRTVWQGLVNDDLTAAALIERLLDTYRRGRKRCRQLTPHSSPEQWHEFRKLAKRWQYQGEWLSSGTENAEFAPGWDKLTERLGRHHDRELLRQSIRQALAESPARERVLERLQKQQRHCTQKLLEQSRMLYALKCRAMRQHVRQRLIAPPETSPVAAGAAR